MHNQQADAMTDNSHLLEEIFIAPSNETAADRFNPANIAAGCGSNGCGKGCGTGCGGYGIN